MLPTTLRSARQGRNCDRGAVAVEFALVLPVLIMLLFGVTTAGLSFADHLAVTNAVREGARLGAAVPYSPTSDAWANSVQQRVQQVYFNAGSTISLSQICVRLVDDSGSVLDAPTTQGTSCGNEPATPSSMTPGSCVVKVWAAKPSEISLIVFPPLTFSIGARSASYYGRTVESCTA